MRPGPRGQAPAVRPRASCGSDEEIVSDGEAEGQAWVPPLWEEPGGALRQLNGLLPPAAAGEQQQQHVAAARGKAFTRIAPCKPAPATRPVGGGGCSRPSGFRRPMKTAAAAEADRAAGGRAAAEAAELQGSLAASEAPQRQREGAAELQELGGGALHHPNQPAPAPGGQGPSSFLNRRQAPAARPPSVAAAAQLSGQMGCTDSPAAAAPAAEGSGSDREEAAATQPRPKRQHPPPLQHQQPGQQSQLQQANKQQQQRPRPPSASAHAVSTQPPIPALVPAAPAPALQAAAAAAPAGPPAAIYHRTADGLNVVYLNRQAQQEQPEVGGGRGRADSVNTGWGNNFVRIDMKKGKGSTKYGTKHGSKKRKGGGRGRGRGGSKWQTQRLRQVGDGSDFMEGWQASRQRCFKCGGGGHFAKDCTAEQQAQADMGALCGSGSEEEEEVRGSDGNGSAAPGLQSKEQQQRMEFQHYGSSGGPPRIFSAASLPAAASEGRAAVDLAEQHASVLAEPSQEALTGVLRSVFGHPAFRGLQLATVQRLLAGESLLSIMPTGMGKSLCYQLPAALLPGLTLVVSPLIALMHDQAASVPPPLTAAVLWSGQSRVEAQQVLADVAVGRVKVLFVSPERLNNPHLLEALRPCMPLPLVVVDEAHCVAEWGHSFRPAYFRLGAALASGVQAERILALTATATRPTEEAIRQVLRIPPASVLRDAAVRQNLRLQVLRTSGGGSSQATRDRICGLFATSGPLASVRSGIVYCAFKEDANQLARLLSARGVNARAYHAGKDYRERSAVEADFAAGRLRVVVATVAFGMGINLASVRAVVHATMPRSLEEYVQQIGRAGRDGSEARCVALLDDSDFVRLRSLAFSGVLDLPAVRGFLEAVFSPVAEGEKRSRVGARKPTAAAAAAAAGGRGRKRKAAVADVGAPVVEGKEVEDAAAAPAAATDPSSEPQPEQQAGAEGQHPGEGAEPAARRFGVLAVHRLSTELDMREDSMETVLSYLEADDCPCLRMLPTAALSVKVSFYAASPEQLALQYPVVKSVLEACPMPRNGVYNAPAAKLAAAAQKAPGLVLQELRAMAAGSLIGFELSREEGPAYEILHTPADLDSLAQRVHDRLASVLACQVARLDVSYRALDAARQAGQAAASTGERRQQRAEEDALRAAVERYFDDAADAARSSSSTGQPGCAAAASDGAANAVEGSYSSASLLLDTQGLPLKRAEPSLLQAARAVLRRNREQAGPALSGRALARILHGVGSPAFKPDPWHKRMGAFWGSQAHVDFGAVLAAATIVGRDDV